MEETIVMTNTARTEKTPVISRVGAFAEYVSEDDPFVLLDNHTDYKDTWYLHVLTEYVSEDDSVL